MTQLPRGGLVLYKRHPACVKETVDGTRLEIETEAGKTRRVRAKDVVLLHPGPTSLRDLTPPEPLEDVDSVRELLHAEGACELSTLGELLFGTATPAAAWASWQLVEEGLHFEGTPDAVRARSARDVADELERRERIAAEALAWSGFVERVRAGGFDPSDADLLRELQDLARGRRDSCRLLRELSRAETPESAHALLLQIGRWTAADVPYPERAALPTSAPAAALEVPSCDARTDLTHLTAFAVDDEGSRDPDDAVSIDADGALWVHVADVSALVPPDSPADLEARARGATLYLPDGSVPMLPPEAVARLGLGLSGDGTGPALSFRIELSADGSIAGFQALPSTVRVQRLTYEQAEPLLDTDHPLRGVAQLTERVRERRLAAGAVDLEWPEIRIRVEESHDGPVVDIRPLAPLRSRRVVAESMILAGQGAAHHATETGIPLPFSLQDASADGDEPDTSRRGYAAAFALRRRQLPSRVSGSPAPHRGLGLEAYVRATSPMRRYLDLLVHQQLRAAITGGSILDETTLMERAAAAEAIAGLVRTTERQANRHWTLVWLGQQPAWSGHAELIDTRGRRALLLIPELSLETSVSLPPGGIPGSCYQATVRGVNLPRLDLHLELTPD